MNREEAKSILEEQFARFALMSYAELESLARKENVLGITGPSGTRYYFDVYVKEPDNGEDWLEVEAFISLVGGRRISPPCGLMGFIMGRDGHPRSRWGPQF